MIFYIKFKDPSQIVFYATSNASDGLTASENPIED